MRYTRVIVLPVMLLLSTSLLAENVGLLAGRVANPAALPQTFLEVGGKKDDDLTYIGGRINYQYSERITLYGDFGKATISDDSFDDIEGNGFGGGIFYHLPGLLDGYDVTARLSYHKADVSGKNTGQRQDNGAAASLSVDITASEISAELLISGLEPIADNGLMWYATIGAHKLDNSKAKFSGTGFSAQEIQDFNNGASSDSDTEFGAGLGVVLPVSMGELYAGADYIDGAQYGAGFRYFVK